MQVLKISSAKIKTLTMSVKVASSSSNWLTCKTDASKITGSAHVDPYFSIVLISFYCQYVLRSPLEFSNTLEKFLNMKKFWKRERNIYSNKTWHCYWTIKYGGNVCSLNILSSTSVESCCSNFIEELEL